MVDEEYICNMVVNMLKDERDPSKFGIEHRSSSYTSLVYCDNDFFRVKYTAKARWITIFLAKEDRNKDDLRFAAQTNKNQLQWKAEINSEEDILMFRNELLHACHAIGKEEYVPRSGSSTITLGYDFNKNEIIK